MFLKNLCFFDFLASRKTHNRNSKATILFTWGLVFILLLAVISLAFVQCGELFEFEDLPSMEGSAIAWTTGPFPIMSSSAFELGIFAMILFFEYLRSHIGEKLFAGWVIELDNSSFYASFKTALLVPSFFVFTSQVLDAAQRLDKVFPLIVDRINFVQENF